MSRIIVLFGLLYCLNSHAGLPAQSLYLDGAQNPVAVILLHGRGKNPDWLVVGPARKTIHSRLGYHTLSLQLPNDLDHWRDYADVFEDVYQQINFAVKYLKQEKQVGQVYLLGHSMGARMASAYLANNPDHQVAGLVVVGCRNNGGIPLSCYESLMNVSIPVLDIWGEDSDKDVMAGKERQSLQRTGYTQVSVRGADHRFDGEESMLLGSLLNWFRQQSDID